MGLCHSNSKEKKYAIEKNENTDKNESKINKEIK